MLPLSGLDVFGVSGWFLFVGASFDDEDVWGRGLAPACRVNCFDAVVALSTGTSDVTFQRGLPGSPGTPVAPTIRNSTIQGIALNGMSWSEGGLRQL